MEKDDDIKGEGNSYDLMSQFAISRLFQSDKKPIVFLGFDS